MRAHTAHNRSRGDPLRNVAGPGQRVRPATGPAVSRTPRVHSHALRGFAAEMMAGGTTAGTMLAMGELIGHLDARQDKALREFKVAFAQFARTASRQPMHRLGDPW